MLTKVIDFILSLLKRKSTEDSSILAPLEINMEPIPSLKENPPKNEIVCNLKLLRKWFTANSTVGELYINGVFFCYTLEDVVRADGVKIYAETAIPAGQYGIILNFSDTFQRILPLLLDVKGFTGVRIHAGNSNKDTKGCILVGETRSTDWVGSSQSAMKKLMPILEQAAKITLEIINNKA